MEHVEQNAILNFEGTLKCRGPFFPHVILFLKCNDGIYFLHKKLIASVREEEMDPLDIIQGLQSLMFVFWSGDEVEQLYKKSPNFSQAHC